MVFNRYGPPWVKGRVFYKISNIELPASKIEGKGLAAGSHSLRSEVKGQELLDLKDRFGSNTIFSVKLMDSGLSARLANF